MYTPSPPPDHLAAPLDHRYYTAIVIASCDTFVYGLLKVTKEKIVYRMQQRCQSVSLLNVYGLFQTSNFHVPTAECNANELNTLFYCTCHLFKLGSTHETFGA